MLDNLTFLIFSRNRAFQLHSLLNSIKHQWLTYPRFHILYSYTDEFKSGYDKLIDMKMFDIVWQKDTDLYTDFLKYLDICKTKYICMCSDDSIFYRPVNITNDLLDKIFDEDTICFNFRIGLNTIIQDYIYGTRQPNLTNYTNENGILSWNYKMYSDVHNYGYPFSCDGHCHLTSDLKYLSNKLAPNAGKIRHWEGLMNGSQNRHLIKNRMKCFETSVLFNNPINCVQIPPLYFSQTCGFSEKDLNNLFLTNKILDLSKLPTEVNGAHYEHKIQII